MIIAIDPSIRAVGLAIRGSGRDGKIESFGQIELESTSHEWTQRAAAMARCVVVRCMGYMCGGVDNEFILETPEHWANSARGRDSENNEAVQKVYWVVGAIIGMISTQLSTRDTIHVVRPSQWKGNVSKPMMVERAKRHLTECDLTACKFSHDAYEAVCLASWWSRRPPNAVQIRPALHNLQPQTSMLDARIQ